MLALVSRSEVSHEANDGRLLGVAYTMKKKRRMGHLNIEDRGYYTHFNTQSQTPDGQQLTSAMMCRGTT